MSWNELSFNPKTLEANTVNKVYENIVYLRDALVEAGYTISGIVQVSAEQSTPISQIESILTGIENDLTVLNNEIPSIYYGEPWGDNIYFRKEDYQRWILILNDLYDIIIGGKGKWGIFRLNDGIPTINGKPIAIRGDISGT